MAKVKQDQDGNGVTVNGVHYICTVAPIHDLSGDSSGYRMSFGFEPDTPCPCNCPNNIPHSIPGAERVAHSVEEAVEKGWLGRDES